MRAAWMWASKQKDATALSGLVHFTKRYLDIQGRYGEGFNLMERALKDLDVPDKADDLPLDERGELIARLLIYKALFMGDMGRSVETPHILKACLAYFRRTGNKSQMMACLNALGITQRFLGNEEKAADDFRGQLEIARELKNRHEEATALNNLCTAMNVMEKFVDAERMLKECLVIRRELNDEAGISSTLINLGVALYNQGRDAEVKPLLYEAIEISRRINQPRNLAGALGNLGGIFKREGQYEEALKLFMQGLETHRNTGYPYGIAIALDNVGTAYYYLGNEREVALLSAAVHPRGAQDQSGFHRAGCAGVGGGNSREEWRETVRTGTLGDDTSSSKDGSGDSTKYRRTSSICWPLE